MMLNLRIQSRVNKFLYLPVFVENAKYIRVDLVYQLVQVQLMTADRLVYGVKLMFPNDYIAKLHQETLQQHFGCKIHSFIDAVDNLLGKSPKVINATHDGPFAELKLFEYFASIQRPIISAVQSTKSIRVAFFDEEHAAYFYNYYNKRIFGDAPSVKYFDN